MFQAGTRGFNGYNFKDGTTASWTLGCPVSDMQRFKEKGDDFERLPLRQEDWDEKIGTVRSLSLPIHRFSEDVTSILLPPDCTLRQLIEAVDAFYMKPLTASDLEPLHDCMYNYLDEAKKKLAAGETVTYLDLMGELKYYEGVEAMDDGSLRLMLGS